jgi:hypothetical protein
MHAIPVEISKKHWRNPPEVEFVPALQRYFPLRRVETLMKKSASKKSIEEWEPASVPETTSLTILREAAAECTACPLYKRATQTVFGEGHKDADLA